jgi:uncharacterized protein YndB with AHSA1/START domain
MTQRQLGNEATSILAEGSDITMERIFDAPRDLVWTAMTTPEHVHNWWGPHGNYADVQQMDVRPGGKWRIAPAGGKGVAFAGEFLEVAPPERFVRTSAPEMGDPNTNAGTDTEDDGQPAIESITLEDLGGRTKMIYHGRFPSPEVLEFALAQGMTRGILEQFDRLADLLPQLDGTAARP